MKKLLMMTYDLPYPPDSGGKTRAYNMIKFLSDTYDITLLSFVRDHTNEEKIRHLKMYCKEIHTILRKKVWSFDNLFKTSLSDKPLAVHVYESREMKLLIEKLQEANTFDFVLLESFYTSGYIDSFKNTKIILGTENLEYFFYKRYTDNVKLVPLRIPMYFDVTKMKRFEEETWRKSDIVLAVSEVDAQTIRAKTNTPVFVVPNAVDVDFFDEVRHTKHSEKRALFVGSWKYIQNIDAARYLIKEVWPEILQQVPTLRLWLVGRNPPKQLTQLLEKGRSTLSNEVRNSIEFKSDIEDIRNAYSQVDLSLIPIRAASGTRLKALESLAARVPVVSTSIGVEGIDVVDTQSVLIAENPKEFGEQVKKIVTSPEKSRAIAANAYTVVKQNYSWRSVITDLKKHLNAI